LERNIYLSVRQNIIFIKEMQICPLKEEVQSGLCFQDWLDMVGWILAAMRLET
jgi:hypothetical protein